MYLATDGENVMSAMDVFEKTNHTIERVATACGVFAEMLQNGTRVPSDVLLRVVDFLRVYGNQYHHEQAEWLFALLREKGVPSGSWPIAILDHEERRLATLIEELANSIAVYEQNGGVNGMMMDTLRALAELYADHIWKEDYLLLPMAQKLLSEGEQEVLADTLRMVEADKGIEAREIVKQLSIAIKSCPECQS